MYSTSRMFTASKIIIIESCFVFEILIKENIPHLLSIIPILFCFPFTSSPSFLSLKNYTNGGSVDEACDS